MRSFVCCRDRGYLVHRGTRRPTCFHARRCAVLDNRYLRSCGTILRPFSREASSSSEFLQFDHRSRLSARALTYQGLCPHRDITTGRLPCTKSSTSSLRSVLRRSQPLDGFLRSAARELVSSHSRVQGSSCSGVSPLCTATLPRREELPPCRWRKIRSPMNRLPRSRRFDFEAFLHAESRVVGSAVRPRPRPLPSSGFVLLQVISRPLSPVPRRQTLMTFPARTFDSETAAPRPDDTPPACSQPRV